MSSPTELEPLIRISRQYGVDPAFVLAGGGNTSLKNRNRLWIKASGHALATIDASGFVELDRDKLEQMLHDNWPSDVHEREALFVQRVMATRVHPELNQRPSVESLLHHLMPQSLVAHTHPGAINALTCCVKGGQLAVEWFGDEILWQPYVDPGLILARELRQALSHYRDQHGDNNPTAIFLENHGLIVGGASEDEITSKTERIVSAVRNRSTPLPALPHVRNEKSLHFVAEQLKAHDPSLHVSLDTSVAACWLSYTSAGKAAALTGPLTPDQVVYCRSFPLWIDYAESAIDDWGNYKTQFGFKPWVVVLAGHGIIAVRDSDKMAEITRAVYLDATQIARGADQLGGVRALSSRDRKFIENWEVEAHRRAVISKAK